MGEGKSGSTLGDKSKRTSNIEVNSYLKSKKEEQQDEPGDIESSDTAKEPSKPRYIEPVEKTKVNTPSGKPIYEWKDENGTLHISNDLGTVPTEYQNQFYESESEGTGQ